MTCPSQPPAAASPRTELLCATSNPMQISYVLEIILQVHPQSLLDIGCGSGKYGVLAREHFRHARIDGIEGFAPYVTPVHHTVYTQVHIGNALELVPGLTTHYDLAIMIDMFEHLTLADGRRLLQALALRATNILVSVPADHPQHHAIDGNELQRHEAQYDVGSLRALGFRRVWRISGNWIAFQGPAPVRLRPRILRTAIAGLLPHWLVTGLAPLSRRLFPADPES
ncbi:hypothetical protein HQ590_09535 [bacterium]|nr:hypothetical protein [bacterium]